MAGCTLYPSWVAGGVGTRSRGVLTRSLVEYEPTRRGRKHSAAVLGTCVRVEPSDRWIQGGQGGRLVVSPAWEVGVRHALGSGGNEGGLIANGVWEEILGWKKGRGSRL